MNRFEIVLNYGLPDGNFKVEFAIRNEKNPFKKLDENRAKELNLDFSRKALVLGCGANYGPAKLWPVEYFAKVSDYWISKGGMVVGLGSIKDIPTVEAIYSNLNE